MEHKDRKTHSSFFILTTNYTNDTNLFDRTKM